MGITLTVMVCLALSTTSLAQKPTTPETDTKQAQKDSKESKAGETKAAAKLPYSIKTRKSPILNISLKAEKAKMSEVAQELVLSFWSKKDRNFQLLRELLRHL